MAGFISQITTFCAPSQVNLVLGVLAFIVSLTALGFIASSLHLLFVFLWCLVLNWLCCNGLAWLSWFLVLWPFLLLLIGVIIWLVMKSYEDLRYLSKKVSEPQYSPQPSFH